MATPLLFKDLREGETFAFSSDPHTVNVKTAERTYTEQPFIAAAIEAIDRHSKGLRMAQCPACECWVDTFVVKHALTCFPLLVSVGTIGGRVGVGDNPVVRR